MVSEHFKQGFAPDLLRGTFSTYVLGMGIMAVFSGVVAGFAVEQCKCLLEGTTGDGIMWKASFKGSIVVWCGMVQSRPGDIWPLSTFAAPWRPWTPSSC